MVCLGGDHSGVPHPGVWQVLGTAPNWIKAKSQAESLDSPLHQPPTDAKGGYGRHDSKSCFG